MLEQFDISVKQIRQEMGLSQSELAAMVGIGLRAIQSYEQKWRNPSEMVERMLLLLLIAHRNGAELSQLRCWEQKKCTQGMREKCIAYVTRQGHLCWFFTGTMCEGYKQKSWSAKINVCLTCDVMLRLLSSRDS